MKIFLYFIILISINATIGYPTDNNLKNEFEQNGDYFEGDMILNNDQINSILYPRARNGLILEKFRWPNKTVYVEFDKVFDTAHLYHIKAGLKKIEEETCIHFEPKTNEIENYIYVTGTPGSCHSEIGYQGGKQLLNLAITPLNTGCFKLGTIIHEFIHALGFYHQQSAADRDSYVTVIEENIQKGKKSNFKKYENTIVSDFGIKYDYGSLMHYGPKTFSRNNKPTIVPIEENVEIGQRIGMSEKDILKINLMYKCL